MTGGAGTNYGFDVIFRANDNNFGAPITSVPVKTATFTVTGTPTIPTNLNNTKVFINPNSSSPTGYITYNANPGTPNPFNGANLGSYDVNTGILNLNGGSAMVATSNGDQVGAVRLFYRVFKQGTTSGLPAYTNVALTNGGTGSTYSNTTSQINLVTNVPVNSGTGAFIVQVYYEVDITPQVGTPRTLRDDNGGNAYTANFTLTGVPILTDTWTGNINDDWFNMNNWDLGFVPTANTNVTIPDFGSGSTKSYPNIYAGSTFKANNGAVVNNTMSGPAFARNLLLAGSTQAQRTILRLYTGTLKIYGDFTNNQDSFIQRNPTTLEFAGGNQTLTGGSNFDTVVISGGSTKTLTGKMNILTEFHFDTANGGGVFVTDVSRVTINYVELGGRSSSAPNGAQLTGENEQSYIRGFVQTTRSSVLANEMTPAGQPDPRTFGNIGLTLYFKGANSPGDVYVTRNTAESYTPLSSTSGQPGRYGIRRIFGVRPSSLNTNNGGLTADLTFTYRDAELTNLGPVGDGTVPEPNLALFVSTSGGNQFGYLGRDALDQVNNILTKYDVRTFATFTLGDRNNPLPVSLTGFDAKRIGTDALVTWQTASEQNNKGFNVQVSTDGKTYRNIGFVASETPNSTAPKAYTFTDTEKNKAGARYYRLEQLDVDGKSTFFAPRVVSFDGKVAEVASGIVAYPNPLNNETLHLSLTSSVSGTGVVRIMDMTGRQVAQHNLDITIGSNDVTLEKMSELKSGLYILNVMLPSGEKKTMKVTKQ
ncbi:MAG: T9SS type A sorting domain-containing protein [Bacteroidota bacterium]|nr:T9SS type A sorting domain-containing protein [Bacteroidota bacterium]